MIYMDKDQIISQPRNEFQVADLAKWLNNAPIGSHPQSDLNPVLFSY